VPAGRVDAPRSRATLNAPSDIPLFTAERHAAVRISELRGTWAKRHPARLVVTTRSSGKIAFVVLRTARLRASVLSKKEVSEIPGGLRGSLRRPACDDGIVRTTRAPRAIRAVVASLELLGASPTTRSLQRAWTTFLFEHRHLWLRTRRRRACRVRHEVNRRSGTISTRRVHPGDTPILTGAIGEEAATCSPRTTSTWARPTWRRPDSSTSSGRAHWEGLLLRPTFRAEKSKTRRHLTEFWMVEPEWRSTTRTPTCGPGIFVSYIVHGARPAQGELRS